MQIEFSAPSWHNVEEEKTDEIDLQMLKEIAEDPNCSEYVDMKEAVALLGLDSHA